MQHYEKNVKICLTLSDISADIWTFSSAYKKYMEAASHSSCKGFLFLLIFSGGFYMQTLSLLFQEQSLLRLEVLYV